MATDDVKDILGLSVKEAPKLEDILTPKKKFKKDKPKKPGNMIDDV